METSLTDATDVGLGCRQDRSRQMKCASRILAARNERRKFFPPVMFGEPAWEMLLALYAAECQGPRPTVTSLCQNSGFPLTTALRWLHFLEGERLVSRESSPVDKRVYYLDLTEKARLALDELLLEIQSR
jgi:DNA-binding MarR family transcriptional regulator